jgi:GAF domain-containing protein
MDRADYQRLTKQALSLIETEHDLVANLSNISAFLNMELVDINCVGFYLVKGNELVLGPFQGKPACVRIPIGKGVCGTAAEQNAYQSVRDVDQFEGHIVCDAESRSELVVPFSIHGEVAGVLDIDSPKIARFDETDEQGMVFLMTEVEKMLNSHAIES